MRPPCRFLASKSTTGRLNFSSTIRQGVLCNYGKTADSVPAPEDDTSVGHFGTDVRVVPLSLLYLWLSAERCMLLCADLEGLGAGRAGGRQRRACRIGVPDPLPTASATDVTSRQRRDGRALKERGGVRVARRARVRRRSVSVGPFIRAGTPYRRRRGHVDRDRARFEFRIFRLMIRILYCIIQLPYYVFRSNYGTFTRVGGREVSAAARRRARDDSIALRRIHHETARA